MISHCYKVLHNQLQFSSSIPDGAKQATIIVNDTCYFCDTIYHSSKSWWYRKNKMERYFYHAFPILVWLLDLTGAPFKPYYVRFDLYVNVRNKSAWSYIHCSNISITLPSNLLEMMQRYDQVLMHHIMPMNCHFIQVKFLVCFR